MITADILNIQTCRANPDTIYVFGDNLKGYGKGGQAQIRDEPNAYGIPTKREPSWAASAFFSDAPDEIAAIATALRGLVQLQRQGKVIVFPSAGLGTGRARMATLSPKLFEGMNTVLTKHFGV